MSFTLGSKKQKSLSFSLSSFYREKNIGTEAFKNPTPCRGSPVLPRMKWESPDLYCVTGIMATAPEMLKLLCLSSGTLQKEPGHEQQVLLSHGGEQQSRCPWQSVVQKPSTPLYKDRKQQNSFKNTFFLNYKIKSISQIKRKWMSAMFLVLYITNLKQEDDKV